MGTPPPTSSVSQPDSQADARFLPGTVLAGRYRIVGPIGRGGMGEVYRADDLKLGQAVALKFLPEGLDRSRDRLDRFFNEVRMARQVTHPSVCRVYDTGEFEGQHFISMEYVDGEDLASLLRRIGRLPHEKALQIARQMCAGVAAAHEEGILHRDLKPANVMLDGRGRVKITDFGLAGLAEGFRGAEIRAGTPTYMAPEQLSGQQVTVRSDIYSMGLVLYELFTGKPAYEARTPAELSSMHETTPTSPSSVVDGFDPSVERVILRCLEREPHERPISALAVAAALPGGDPLAAALAAGETPSPEMVAASGGEGGVKPAIAIASLLVILLGLAGFVLSNHRSDLFRHFALDEKPPDALRVDAREILAAAGHDVERGDSAHGMHVWREHGDWALEQDDFPGDWEDIGDVRPGLLGYWYRESPRKMVPRNFFDLGTVDLEDPPRDVPGMALVRLDVAGRLIRLEIIPPGHDTDHEPRADPDWTTMFARAGLDFDTFAPAQPEWNPLFACDVRSAWAGGTYPGQPDVPIRVEAGSYKGKPIYFAVTPPWERAEPVARDAGQNFATAILVVVLFGILIGGVSLARRNLLLGRGDRRGAFRIALSVFSGLLAAWILGGDHVGDFSEVGLILQNVSLGLFLGGSVWVVYIALEPHVRRLWPDLLISWTRLLSGRFRDPLVGRSILAGGVCFVGLVLIAELSDMAQAGLGLPPDEPGSNTRQLLVMMGSRQAIGVFFISYVNAVFMSIGMLFVLLLFRVLFRRQLPAIIAFVLVLSLPGSLGSDAPFLFQWVVLLVVWSLIAFALIRFGLLALVSWLMFTVVGSYPITLDFSTWFAGRTLVVLLFLVALTVYSCWISLAGRSLVARGMLEEPAR